VLTDQAHRLDAIGPAACPELDGLVDLLRRAQGLGGAQVDYRVRRVPFGLAQRSERAGLVISVIEFTVATEDGQPAVSGRTTVMAPAGVVAGDAS